jgi:hypothetical protein
MRIAFPLAGRIPLLALRAFMNALHVCAGCPFPIQARSASEGLRIAFPLAGRIPLLALRACMNAPRPY